MRAEIARQKQAILALLQGADASADHLSAVIPGAADARPAPLSFAQERFWFLEQLAPGSAVFNLCRAVRVTGALDLAALESSVNEILRRHEALRTKFIAAGGRPLQIVAPAEAAAPANADLRSLPEAEREAAASRLLLDEARRPFDLAQGRLLRVPVIRVGDEAYLLAIVTHHMVADAWSMGILTRDLWALYEDFCAGKAPPPVESSCRYRDYAAWQRGHWRREALQPGLAYWKERLADLPLLDLPTDHPRPLTPSYRGAKVAIVLPKPLTGALNELSRREGATLFMTLLAAFQILLHRYSGQDDIAVGSPVANRERREFESIAGLFVGTLVLRGDLSGAPSFREVLRRAREVCLGAYAHQSTPFELLVEELGPPRDARRHPLFQVMFVLQNTPGAAPKPRGLTLEPAGIDNETSQFDLSLYLRERVGRLTGFFEYSTDLFDRSTIERLTKHFQTLLESIVADPDGAIATLPLFSAAERRRLLVEWNDTAAEYPRNSCIHRLFEAQAARAPSAVAFECEQRKLTYRELNSRANGLARELRRMGVGTESLVGVSAERSLETAVSLLAVLKAGGAYLPLDPAYPGERLKFILTDAHPAVLLTQTKFAGYFSDYSVKKLIIDDWLRDPPASAANLRASSGADDAAYVIYTSGSTGIPKGVIAPHRGAINRFSWMWKLYPFGPGEKCCQRTPLSFVDSVWEMFGALLQGVPTAIVPDAVARDPALLVDHLAERNVTRLVVVPSLLQEILDRGLAARLRGLRFCFSSGEALAGALAQRFRAALPACRLINLYGCSEAAADVTYYEVANGDRRATVAIGRPIQNTQIYLLDEHLQPVPTGARGEVYAGGDNLARGYLHRPELTAEKFIANPFPAAPSARLYRTGDLARYGAGGDIEYLGRIDQQVKIRGCRVEPGEVEAALAAHPAVRECLVTVEAAESGTDQQTPNPQSNNLLVAYVVPGGRLAAGALRSFLRDKLPDFMLPARFVLLDGLPRLPNGKADRRALPAPPSSRAHREENFSTEIERLVAQIWRGLLNVDSIGIDDNFFELGGHSLMAAAIAAQLRDVFARPIAVRDLFDAPTVAGLAKRIENLLKAPGGDGLPPLRPAPHRRNLPLSFSQAPLFVLAQLFGGGDFLNMPYAYRLSGRLETGALRRALQEIVRRHGVLRTGFLDSGDGPRQFIRRGVKLALPIIDLARRPEKQKETALERISKRDAAQTFDLEKPPLMRAKLVRTGEREHILLVTLHHLITDQWSMGLFRRELAALYGAYSKGQFSPLPEVSVQFIDFACWQRELVERGCLARQISFWENKLSAPAPALEFRRPGKRRTPPRYHSSRRPFELDAAVFGRIKAFARAQNCTPFMVFIAALNILLHRHTGQTDIRIGTLAANRGQPGADCTIGYFVNALVLRTRIERRMTVAELVKSVRQTCVEAYAHQDLPFEYLEELITKRQRQGGRPLYQVMLNYRNQWSAPLEANGLTIASWDGKNRAADPGLAPSRLDVSFHLRELSTRLTGAVNYKTDLFDDATIEEFIADYAAIVERMVAHPEAKIAEKTIRCTHSSGTHD